MSPRAGSVRGVIAFVVAVVMLGGAAVLAFVLLSKPAPTIPRGTLEVVIEPERAGFSLSPRGMVRVMGDGVTREVELVGTSVRVEGLPLGRLLRVELVSGTTMADPETVTLGLESGARATLRGLPVWAPPTGPAPHNPGPADKVLHVSWDASEVRLDWISQIDEAFWATRFDVVVRTALPAETDYGRPALRAKLATDWAMNGSHKDPEDVRLDVALLHAPAGARVAELLPMVDAVLSLTRAAKGSRVPVFRLLVGEPPAVEPREDERARALDPVARDRAQALADAGATERALLDALALCGHRSRGDSVVTTPDPEPPFAVLENGRYAGPTQLGVCEDATLGALWMHVGEALAGLERAPEATRAFALALALTPEATLDPAASVAARAAADLARATLSSALEVAELRVSSARAPVSLTPAFGALRFCHAEGLGRTPHRAGRMRVRFTIGDDGRTGAVSVATSELSDSVVMGCVSRALHQQVFTVTSATGSVRVEAELRFSNPLRGS